MIPHRCPVCNGAGKVESTLYEAWGSASVIDRATCHSCLGTGVVRSVDTTDKKARRR